MTADDDPENPDNDPMIKSMRSVWLGMREEDPPERGLAELMAAARTQATAMKPEPWWRKMFAVMVRPPVMAAAAVVVVIGGAVALKGRGVDEAAMPTVSTRSFDQRANQAPERDGEVAGGDLGKEKLEIAVPGSDPKAADVVAPTAAPTDPIKAGPKVTKPSITKPMVPPHIDEAQQGWSGNVQEDSGKLGVGSATTPPPPPPPPPTKPDPGSGLLIAGETKDVKAPTAGRPEPAPKTDSVDAEPTSIKQTGRADTTEQLVKQAETAATRKDCPAVRATAARIKKSAPDTYKSRVVTQPAIARCLK